MGFDLVFRLPALTAAMGFCALQACDKSAVGAALQNDSNSTLVSVAQASANSGVSRKTQTEIQEAASREPRITILGQWYQVPLRRCPSCPHVYYDFRADGTLVTGYYEGGRWHLQRQAERYSLPDSHHLSFDSEANGAETIALLTSDRLVLGSPGVEMAYQRLLPAYAHGEPPPMFRGMAPKTVRQVEQEILGVWWSRNDLGHVASMTFQPDGIVVIQNFPNDGTVTRTYRIPDSMTIEWDGRSLSGLLIEGDILETAETRTINRWSRARPR